MPGDNQLVNPKSELGTASGRARERSRAAIDVVEDDLQSHLSGPRSRLSSGHVPVYWHLVFSSKGFNLGSVRPTIDPSLQSTGNPTIFRHFAELAFGLRQIRALGFLGPLFDLDATLPARLHVAKLNISVSFPRSVRVRFVQARQFESTVAVYDACVTERSGCSSNLASAIGC